MFWGTGARPNSQGQHGENDQRQGVSQARGQAGQGMPGAPTPPYPVSQAPTPPYAPGQAPIPTPPYPLSQAPTPPYQPNGTPTPPYQQGKTGSPLQRLADARRAPRAQTRKPSAHPDGTPAPLPASVIVASRGSATGRGGVRARVIQRFSGTGLAPKTTVQRQERRARRATGVLALAAVVLIASTAILLFDPAIVLPTFGFALGQRLHKQYSGAPLYVNGTQPPTPATPRMSPTPKRSNGPPPKPTATPKPRPAPTSTPTPARVDGASVSNSGNTAQNPGATFGVTFTAKNTGNTTWTTGAGYVLVCEANCYGAGTQTIKGSIGPGQTYVFNIGMATTSSGNILTENYSASNTIWQMQHKGVAFGNPSSLTVITHGWSTAYGPMTPCPGSNGWVTLQGTIGCSNGQGYLQTTSLYYPEMDLQGWTVSNTGQFRMESHVNLTTNNSGNYEGDLVIDTPKYPSFGGTDFGVRANGTWTVWICCNGNIPIKVGQSSVTPSTSYDLAVVASGGTIHYFVNGGEVWSMPTSNIPNPGNEQGIMQWWNVQSKSDYSYWSSFQLANWQ